MSLAPSVITLQQSQFFFWPHCAACGILVPRPGIEPVPRAVEVGSPNHWTAREFSVSPFLNNPGAFVLNPSLVPRWQWALYWVDLSESAANPWVGTVIICLFQWGKPRHRGIKNPAYGHTPRSGKAGVLGGPVWILSAPWISRSWGFGWFLPSALSQKGKLERGRETSRPWVQKANKGTWMDQDCGQSSSGGDGVETVEDRRRRTRSRAPGSCHWCLFGSGQVRSLGTTLCPALCWHDPNLPDHGMEVPQGWGRAVSPDSAWGSQASAFYPFLPSLAYSVVATVSSFSSGRLSLLIVSLSPFSVHW